MTPAGFRYIAAHYERAVDKGLDVPAIRSYLQARGLRRSLHQVELELEHTYGFVGYVARHPAQPALTRQQIADAYDR